MDGGGDGVHDLDELWAGPGEGDFEEDEGAADLVDERQEAAVAEGYHLFGHDLGAAPGRDHVEAVDGVEDDGPRPGSVFLGMVGSGGYKGFHGRKGGEVDFDVLVLEGEKGIARGEEDIRLAVL